MNKNRIRNILVLGYFGYNNNQLDGQTVKTRDLYKLIKDQYIGYYIDKFDTQDFKYSKLSIFKMFKKLCKCNKLIYLPAHNNLKYIFPIIFPLSIIFRYPIYYFVIGGWLIEYLRNLPVHRWMLSKIKGILVETHLMQNNLSKAYKFNNVRVFPNFRFFDFTPSIHRTSNKFNLVFLARINKKKGLDWIFNFCKYIKDNRISDQYSITFYGPMYENDKQYFTENINKYDFVKYNGELQPKDIHATISKYDLLLLPTHYYTEGLPGSIVDAYISGIPVIVTKWKHANEFVLNGKTGYIIPFENGESQLIEIITFLNNNKNVLIELQKEILSYRKNFSPPNIKNFL